MEKEVVGRMRVRKDNLMHMERKYESVERNDFYI